MATKAKASPAVDVACPSQKTRKSRLALSDLEGKVEPLLVERTRTIVRIGPLHTRRQVWR